MKKYEDKQIAELFSRLHKVFTKHENRQPVVVDLVMRGYYPFA